MVHFLLCLILRPLLSQLQLSQPPQVFRKQQHQLQFLDGKAWKIAAIISGLTVVSANMSGIKDKIATALANVSEEDLNKLSEEQLDAILLILNNPEEYSERQKWGALNQEVVMAAAVYDVKKDIYSQLELTKENHEEERKGRKAKKLLNTPIEDLEEGVYVWDGYNWVPE